MGVTICRGILRRSCTAGARRRVRSSTAAAQLWLGGYGRRRLTVETTLYRCKNIAITRRTKSLHLPSRRTPPEPSTAPHLHVDNLCGSKASALPRPPRHHPHVLQPSPSIYTAPTFFPHFVNSQSPRLSTARAAESRTPPPNHAPLPSHHPSRLLRPPPLCPSLTTSSYPPTSRRLAPNLLSRRYRSVRHRPYMPL